MSEVVHREKKPWHRREDESAKAFHAFVLYRDMLTKERSIQNVQIKLGGKPSYFRHLARWSSKYRWVERATLHDDHMAEVRREAHQKAIEEMTERQAKEGLALQEIGMRRFHSKEGAARDGVASTMDDRDAILAIEKGAKLERTARGEPGEITKHEIVPVAGKRLEDMTDEELDEIIARRGALPEGQEE